MFNSIYNIKNFEGVVESRQDPLELGRVQVRVFGIHTDNLTQIPTSDLQWMQIMYPVTSGALSGVSESPNLLEGTHVVGYFRDGDLCQDGIVIGCVAGIPQTPREISKGFNDPRTNLSKSIVPGKPSSLSYQDGSGVSVTEADRVGYPKTLDEPDTSRLARNRDASNDTVLGAKIKSQQTQTNIPIAGGGTFSEPTPPYNAKYPYNHVKESESGHVFEFDDTPSEERVHLAHRVGSFIEMHKNGTVVNKSAKDAFDIVHADAYRHVEGTENITIDKGAKLFINASGSSAGYTIQIGAGGNLEITVSSGDVVINVDGNITTNATGDITTTCNGDYIVRANTINLN